MASENKKLALLRILQILEEDSDEKHQMTQESIGTKLKDTYDIEVDRKTIARNVSLLKEAGFDIEMGSKGTYLASREFDDSELRLLIDAVLGSKYITSRQSESLIKRICALSNKYFKSHVKYVQGAKEWNRAENDNVFLNIEVIDEAIENHKQISYNYVKYKSDKKLHRTSKQTVSPYLMFIHNQRYYLMAYNEYWKNMCYHRLDRLSDISIIETEKATPLRSVPGYESGINYKELATTKPYMYSDKPERIDFLVEENIIDQVIDWFGKDITIIKTDNENMVRVSLLASPSAMEHWATQYINHIEVISPESLRTSIRKSLEKGLEKYSK